MRQLLKNGMIYDGTGEEHFKGKILGEGDKKSAFGIRNVMINGKMVLDNNLLHAEALKTSGKAIRG